MPKFLYPKTNYLGPGNPYPNGKPTSSADEIAKRHDKSYIDARTEQDILDSDWNSTKEFANDFIKKPSLQSAVGAVGLGAKTGVERVTGVLYPDMKRKLGGKPIAKQQSASVSTSNQEMDIEPELEGDVSMELAASGSISGGAGGAGVSRSKILFTPKKQTPEYMTRTLRKTYHFFCKNDLPRYIKKTPQGVNDVQLEYTYIQAPPVDHLRLYMSPREEAFFREQFTEVNCENVKIDIYSLGARGQFSTGGTSVTNANMQLQPFIAEFKDIDKDFQTTVDDTAITNFLSKLEGGNPYTVSDSNTFTETIPTFPARSGSRSMSVPLRVVYPNPLSYANNTGTTLSQAAQNQLNWPNTYEYAHMQNGAILAEDTPTFSYNYSPKNKYLFGRNTPFRAESFHQSSAEVQPQTLLQVNNEIIMRTQHTQDEITTGSPADSGAYVMAINPQPGDVRIENQYQHNATEMFKPHRMPRFMFGVMPLRNQSDTSNQEIQWEFLMVTEITLRSKMGAPGIYGHTMNFPEPMWMFPTIQKGRYGNFGAVTTSTDTGTQILTFESRRGVFGRSVLKKGGTTLISQGTGSTTNGITPTRILTRNRNKRLREDESETSNKKNKTD